MGYVHSYGIEFHTIASTHQIPIRFPHLIVLVVFVIVVFIICTGQYWGELGYFRIEAGKNSLGIESEVVWATPKSFTVNNFPCDATGDNCQSRVETQYYTDPSRNVKAIQRRLRRGM